LKSTHRAPPSPVHPGGEGYEVSAASEIAEEGQHRLDDLRLVRVSDLLERLE